MDIDNWVSVPDYGELILNYLQKRKTMKAFITIFYSFRPRLRGTNLKLLMVTLS